MKFHELANPFPMLPSEELAALAKDIKVNGQQFPIVLYEGKILDGRNRWLACKEAGVKPLTEIYKGADPRGHVISLNIKRRHMNETQRAMVAARLSNLELGDNQHVKAGSADLHTLQFSLEQAAKDLNVSRRQVADAKVLLKKAEPAAVAAMDSGKSTVYKEKKKLDRKVHLAELKATRKLTPQQQFEGPYDLILADPPWRYEHCEADNREIGNHYETMDLDAIKKEKPNATQDCILLLWATAPKLAEAMDVMKAWGFNYRTCAVWDKQVIGMGYWFRIQHELLLVGVKGKPKATPESERISSIFSDKRGKHSVKPEAVYLWIERAFPALTKLEMFSRNCRPNWSATGNEV